MRVLSRLPVTVTLITLHLVAGVLGQGLWKPFDQSPAWDTFAYGLPAIEEGRWWAPITGTFLVSPSWLYVVVFAGYAGVAYLEYHRGSRIALGYFAGGQAFAIVATMAFLSLAERTPWPWAIAEAAALDVGPSGGTMACIAASATAMRSPWRERVWFTVLALSIVMLLFWGTLADLEHIFAVLLVLAIQHPLASHRTDLRERRLIAFVGVISLGVAQLLTVLRDTDGPLGDSGAVTASVADVVVDAIVIALIARGLRRGRRWAWVAAFILGGVNIAWAVVARTGVQVLSLPEARFGGDTTPLVGHAVLWVVFLGYLVWARKAFRAAGRTSIGRGPTPTAADAAAEVRAHGGGTLSWMTTWPRMSYLRTQTGLVAYQRHAGVALALSDPLGPADGRAGSITEFVTASERAGLVPCWFGAGEETRRGVPDGWRELIVADDTIVDLPGLSLAGNRWKPLRTPLNRANREGMTFRLTRFKEEPWGVQAQMRSLSQSWVDGKQLPEMGFTLGSIREATDPAVRIALAVSPAGDVDGFVSWLPVYGGEGTITGWTLDLMRRRPGGFVPVMEYLLTSSALQFETEGAQIMSLSGAPLAHEQPPDAGMIAALSERLSLVLEPVYGFRSLHRFKAKFHPRYVPVYLLYRDEGDLARIGAALVRAYLPDASLRQFADAGRGLIRRDERVAAAASPGDAAAHDPGRRPGR